MNPKISIIIPVYNGEKFIDNCITHLINQTYKNIEIIFIDDESTDRTVEILKSYAENDSRILILKQNHSGIGKARNLGLEHVSGDYIMFCDSDDTLSINACEIISNCFKEKESDICIFGYNVIKNKKIIETNVIQLDKNIKTNNKTIKNLRKFLRLQVYVWNKAFKKDFIIKNNLKFAENLICAEDVIFCIQSYLNKAKYTYTKEILYNYISDRAGNTTWQNENCIAHDLNSLKYLLALKELKKINIKQYREIINHFIGGTDYYLGLSPNSSIVISHAQTTIKYLNSTFDYKFLKKLKNYNNIIKKLDNYTKDNSKIDLVYLWCNKNDKNFNQEFVSEVKKYNPENESINNCRFREIEELKYSLRSVEKYANWINKIYIVTNKQIPDWLNTNHPKIKIVDHREILPESAMPNFNSNAIEHCIKNIKGLSKHFIYGNDDTFFNNYVLPETFFTKQGYPIIRHTGKFDNNKNLYTKNLTNSLNLIFQNNFDKYNYYPHHSFDGYYLPDVINCYNNYKKDIDNTINNHFRDSNDIQRVIYDYYSISIKHGRYKYLHNHDRDLPLLKKISNFIMQRYEKDTLYICNSWDIDPEMYLKQYNAKMFCLNDVEDSTDESINNIKNFMINKFPDKSSFEK